LLVCEATGLARSEGIRAGDLIVAINVTRHERVDEFMRTLSRMPPDCTVALLVMRDKRLAYVPVRLPERRGKPSS
jgi:serine protease Do